MSKVSLIIPVYNESSHMQEFLEVIKNFNFSSSAILFQQARSRGQSTTIRNPDRNNEAPVSGFIASPAEEIENFSRTLQNR